MRPDMPVLYQHPVKDVVRSFVVFAYEDGTIHVETRLNVPGSWPTVSAEARLMPAEMDALCAWWAKAQATAPVPAEVTQ